MGLERLCAAVRETPSTYATDLFAPIIEHIRSALGHAQARDEYLTACRVVADHSRAMAFLIAEGVLPGNEGRDYVLRLIMRRAMRYGQMIGLSAPFLGHVTDVVCDSMGEAYPSLQQRKDWIKRVVSTEEERFARTLELGRIRQNEFAAARAAQASALAEVADLAAGAAAQCDSPQGPHLEELAVAARNLRDGIEAAIELPGPVVTEVKAAVRALVNYAQAALQEQPNATALRDELDMIRERLPTGQAGLSGLAAQAVESLWPLLGGLDAWSGDQADRAALFSRLGASLGDQLGRLRTIPGDEVFRLYDTYGFPPELTRMLAAEYGLEIDQEGFEVAMQQQRERARAGQKFRVERAREAYLRLGLGNTEFVGYDTTTAQATVVAVLVDGVATDRATPGSSIEIVLDRSPFYAEAGGQIGDTGELRGPGGLAEVLDTQAVLPGLTVHRARVARASLAVGDEVTASVDAGRRLDIMCNHTATHLLHRALREVLGEHAQQRGSLVAPDRLRFDFAHLSPLTPDDIQRLEQRVNELIRSDLEVRPEHLPLDEARRRGAIMLFGEKYGDVVRMVSIDELSRELCGGTHLDSTGKIGHFVITSESAVGAGVRRVEAVTGRGADSYVRQRLALVEQMAGELGAQTAEQIPGRLASLLSRLHEQEALIQKLQEGLASRGAALIDGVVRVDGIAVLSARVDGLELDGLRRQTDVLRDRLGSAVVVLATVSDDKPQLVVAVTPDVVARGLRANDLVARLSPMLDGGGGGRPELAQAGGRDASRLDEALAVVEELVREWLQQA
jgi:alanyl-tRNA synthetase